jgi:hypothetical protein
MGKQVDTQTVAPVWIVTPEEAEHSDWLKGFALYAEGKSDSACANHAQRTGFFDAIKAESASVHLAVLADCGMTAEQMDCAIEDDYEWIRRGC